MGKTETAAQAAQRAQAALQEYVVAVRAGTVKPDRRKAEKLAEACEKTFKEWMATCREFTEH
jgi:hypothetical protein